MFDRSNDRPIDRFKLCAGVNELMIVTLIDCGELVLPGYWYLNGQLTIVGTLVASDCERVGVITMGDRPDLQTCTKGVELIGK